MSSEEMLGTEILHEPEPGGGSTSVPHSTPIVAEPVECMPWARQARHGLRTRDAGADWLVPNWLVPMQPPTKS